MGTHSHSNMPISGGQWPPMKMERRLTETLEHLASSPSSLATADLSSLESDPLYPLALIQLAENAKTSNVRMISALNQMSIALTPHLAIILLKNYAEDQWPMAPLTQEAKSALKDALQRLVLRAPNQIMQQAVCDT